MENKENELNYIMQIAEDLRPGGEAYCGSFGKNNLTLIIQKDNEYIEGTDDFNIVNVTAIKNGEAIHDTYDVHVSELWSRLSAIWEM